MLYQRLMEFLILPNPINQVYYQVFNQKFSHDKNHLLCIQQLRCRKTRKNLCIKSKIFHHQQHQEFQYQFWAFEICRYSFSKSHEQTDTIPSKMSSQTMVLSILYFPMGFSVASNILLFLLMETTLLPHIVKLYKNGDHKVRNPLVALDCI